MGYQEILMLVRGKVQGETIHICLACETTNIAVFAWYIDGAGQIAKSKTNTHRSNSAGLVAILDATT